MKTELSVEGFHELSAMEEQKTSGGLWHFAAALGIAAVVEIFSDWDNFKNGLMGRPEEKNLNPYYH